MQTNKQRSERAFRLMLVASHNNDIPEGDVEAQIIDVMRNLHHLIEDYATDLTMCMDEARRKYQSDIAEQGELPQDIASL